jgi:hypothetical protein
MGLFPRKAFPISALYLNSVTRPKPVYSEVCIPSPPETCISFSLHFVLWHSECQEHIRLLVYSDHNGKTGAVTLHAVSHISQTVLHSKGNLLYRGISLLSNCEIRLACKASFDKIDISCSELLVSPSRRMECYFWAHALTSSASCTWKREAKYMFIWYLYMLMTSGRNWHSKEGAWAQFCIVNINIRQTVLHYAGHWPRVGTAKRNSRVEIRGRVSK